MKDVVYVSYIIMQMKECTHNALSLVNKRDEDEYEWKAEYLFGSYTTKDVYNSITIVSIRNWYGT